MKKWLITWNIVLTVLLLVVFITGCSGSDSRVDWAVTQIQVLSTTSGQIQNNVSQNSQQIQVLNAEIAALKLNMQSLVSQINDILLVK